MKVFPDSLRGKHWEGVWQVCMRVRGRGDRVVFWGIGMVFKQPAPSMYYLNFLLKAIKMKCDVFIGHYNLSEKSLMVFCLPFNKPLT